MFDNMDKKLIQDLSALRSEVRNHLKCIHQSLAKMKRAIPLDETLQRNSKFAYDQCGDVFLYYDGVYHSFEIVLSIVQKRGKITYESIYDISVNELK